MRSDQILLWAAVVVFGSPSVAGSFATTVGGRSIDLDGALEVREVFETNRSTAHDRTQELLRLRFAAELTDWLRFDSTAVGINGGPRFKATKAGTYNFQDVFQGIDPSVEFEEAFIDLDLHPLDIRLGKQKVFWGNLDRFQPNDLLNPYQFEDLFLQEQEERKIGVPAVQLGYALPETDWVPEEGRLTMVWAPMYVPYRFSEPGDRWFPPAAVSPDTFHIPAGLIEIPGAGFLPATDVPIDFQAHDIAPPARRLGNSSLGLRASGYVSGIDFALYYYHGFDINPAFQLLAEAHGLPDPAEPLGFKVSASTVLEPVFRHIDSWGADAAYAIGPFTLRGEGAFIRGRPFSRDLRLLLSDPSQLKDQITKAIESFNAGVPDVPIDLGASFVQRDTIEWGIGADYTNSGWYLLLQVNQTDVLANDVELLIRDVETRFLLNLRKNFFRDRLHAQLIGLYGVESDYSLLLPRLTLDITDNVDVRVGYLAIMGREHSIVGQYRRNDEGFIRLRLTF